VSGPCAHPGCDRNAVPLGQKAEYDEDRELAPKLYGERGRRLYAPPALRSFEVEALLPFRHGGELGAGAYLSNEWLIAETQRPFFPKGLMLWNAGGLEVSAAFIGTNLELVCGFGSVPAAWFATQQSFEAVVAAQKAGAAAGWGHWTPVHPGVLVRLQFNGPAAHVRALLWGLTT
jgi:hypothetical protein